MYLVGLTGGIASGKSTVAARLVQHGAVEVDADILARRAVEPGSQGLAQIANIWPEVVDADGQLNRSKLGSIVFQDADARKRLEAIVHPQVRKFATEQFSKLPEDSIVIYTVPLLVEAEVDHPFDLVVTVEAPEDERVRRLQEHRGLSREEALSRVRSQTSSANRANRADLILNSNQPLDGLLRDVDQLWLKLQASAKEKRSS